MKVVVSFILVGFLCALNVQSKPVEKETKVETPKEVGLTVLENEFRDLAGDGSYEFK